MTNKILYLFISINLIIIGFFIFRVGIPFVNIPDSILLHTDSVAVFLSTQANQFAVLQVYISIFGIALAIAAFWGYNEIKSGAEKRAEKAVQEAIPSLVKEVLAKIPQEELQKLLFESGMRIQTEQNIKEVLEDGKERMLKDPMEPGDFNE